MLHFEKLISRVVLLILWVKNPKSAFTKNKDPHVPMVTSATYSNGLVKSVPNALLLICDGKCVCLGDKMGECGDVLEGDYECLSELFFRGCGEYEEIDEENDGAAPAKCGRESGWIRKRRQ
jgi:hypothetical protein